MRATEARKIAEGQFLPKAEKELQTVLDIIKCKADQGHLHFMYVPVSCDTVVEYVLKKLEALGYGIHYYSLNGKDLPQYKITW